MEEDITGKKETQQDANTKNLSEAPADQPLESEESTIPKEEDSRLRFRKKCKDDGDNHVVQLQKELQESKDKYLRLYAEYDNFRRRSAKEKIELTQTASSQVLKDLLPIVDDFERAVEALGKAGHDETLQGIKLIHGKVLRLLEQKGVSLMSALGQPFDTDLHEAVTQYPAPSEEMKGKVVDVLEKGYMLHDKVLRFAKVVVGV